jgi:hypothetical protein
MEIIDSVAAPNRLKALPVCGFGRSASHDPWIQV